MVKNKKSDGKQMLLSAEEVAFLLGVGSRTIRRWHQQKVLPAPIRVGNIKLLKWRTADIESWVSQGCHPVGAQKVRAGQ